MKKIFSRFNGVVWPAVLSVAYSVSAVVLAIAGASSEVVIAVSVAGATSAILASNQ
jgi:hypothetical protein